MITLPVEALDGVRQIFDIAYMREHYSTDNNYFVFPSPSLQVIEDNLFYLLSQSVEVRLPDKYFYKPDYVSKDEYGTPALWYIIMYVNGIHNMEEFKRDTIFLPSMESILDITIAALPKKDPEDMETLPI